MSISLSQARILWTSLKNFPWPTITFLAVLMSAWGWWNYIRQTDGRIEDLKGFMVQKDALQQQTIQSQNRLIDKFTRDEADNRNQRKEP